METLTKTAKIKKYPAYKNSGVEWIGEVPKHWEVKKIKYLFEFKKGKNPKEIVLDNNKLPIYLGMDYLRGKPKSIFYVKDAKNCLLVDENDILLLWDGSNSGEFMKAKNGILSSTMAVLRTKLLLDEKFRWFLLKSFEKILKQQTVGMGIPHVNPTFLHNYHLFIPPLSEQTAIANFLDQKTQDLDTAISQKQNLIKLLEERKQIIIQDAVTKGITKNVELKESGIEWIGKIPKHWEVKRLKYVCEINKNTIAENTSQSFEFNYVDIGSVTFTKGIVNTESFLFKNAPSRARRIAQEGDTVISTVRTYLKAIDFVDNEKSNYIYSTGFAVLEPKSIVLDKFLYHFVRSNAFTEQVTINSKGMSYPAINSTDIAKLFTLVCSTEEQQQIVSHIESESKKIDEAISLQKKQIKKLTEYKSVLIDAAVTGKIQIVND